MQILKACFQKPVVEKEVSNKLNRFVVANLLFAELFVRHLVDALAELSHLVRQDGDFFGDLGYDCIHDINQLREHLLIKGVFPLIFD